MLRSFPLTARVLEMVRLKLKVPVLTFIPELTYKIPASVATPPDLPTSSRQTVAPFGVRAWLLDPDRVRVEVPARKDAHEILRSPPNVTTAVPKVINPLVWVNPKEIVTEPLEVCSAPLNPETVRVAILIGTLTVHVPFFPAAPSKTTTLTLEGTLAPPILPLVKLHALVSDQFCAEEATQ